MSKIKSALPQKNLELKNAKRDLASCQKAIMDLRQKRRDIELSVDGIISSEKERAREQELKHCAVDLELELSDVADTLSELRKERAAKLSHYSYEAIRDGVIAQSPLGEDTQKMIHELRREAYATVSPRFVDAYFVKLGKCRVTEADFLDALNGLEDAKEEFYIQRDSRINLMVEGLIDKFKDLQIGDNEDAESQSSGTLIALGVVAIVLSFVLFPIYSIVLGIVSIINLKKSSSMKTALDTLKVVEDNFLLMEKALELRSLEEYQKKQAEIEKEFEGALNDVQGEHDRIGEVISQRKQEVMATFVFDDAEIRANLKETLQGIDHSIEEQKKSEQIILAGITEILNEIKILEGEYERDREKMIREFINFDQVGESRFFPEVFLLNDFEPLDWFERTRASYFFVYQDQESAIDFMKLIVLQTRTRMAPSTCYVQAWDTTSSGVALRGFTNPNPQVQSNLFTILNTTSDVKEEIESLAAIMQKRLTTIADAGQDINQYNDDMVTLKSVTEPYHLLLVLSPEVLLNDEDFRRLLVNGPRLGIYTYIFAEDVRLSDSYLPLIESADYCGQVFTDKIGTQAQAALIEYIKGKRGIGLE